MAGFVQRRLMRSPIRRIVGGGAALLLFNPLSLMILFALIDGRPLRWRSLGEDEWFPLLFGALGIVLATTGVVELVRLGRHEDMQALARYGPPDEVDAAIDAELASPGPLARIGRASTLLGARPRHGVLRGEEVLLTPSWLIHLHWDRRERVDVLRLDSLVLASRCNPLGLFSVGVAVGKDAPPAWAVLADRQGVKLMVGGTEEGVTRLLAEVLARVPWVLDRFDEPTQRAWEQDRTAVVAEADRRREQLRGGE
jgi:hypothetical protein